MFWLAGLSATKGLQMLKAMDIPITELTGPMTYFNPNLPDIVIEDINNALNKGWSVMVPEATGGLPAFPYIKYDPKTGSAGYMIATKAGGYNGYITKNLDFSDYMTYTIIHSADQEILGIHFQIYDPEQEKTVILGYDIALYYKMLIRWRNKKTGAERTETIVKPSQIIVLSTGKITNLSYVIAGHYNVKYNGRTIYGFNVWGTEIYLGESDKYAGITTDANGQDIIEKPIKIVYQIRDYFYDVTVQSLDMKIRKGSTVVRTLTGLQTGEKNEILWDGEDELGNIVAPGEYTVQIEATANGLKTTSRAHKVMVYAVKLCKRDLMGIPYSQEIYGELYHNFIWVKGTTFGFTASEENFTVRCILEGPGEVKEDLTADIAAATSGAMHGSCRIFTCNNPDKLLQHIRDQIPSTPYYYCLSYDPLNNESGGINCQDWANMMLAIYCD